MTAQSVAPPTSAALSFCIWCRIGTATAHALHHHRLTRRRHGSRVLSPVVATLSRDLLTRLGTGEEGGMSHVRTAEGQEGWVESKFVRSPVGYRAAIARHGNSWKIETLVAGD